MAETVAATTASASAKSRPRVDWVDSAKGLCILLVVLGHAVTELANHGYSTGVWAEVNFMLGPIRMPLFFLLSGLFAAKALSESWHRLANRRIWVMVWLYVLWVPLRDTILALLPQTYVTEEGFIGAPRILDSANWGSLLYNSLHALVEPTSYLWFLWALALFAILSKATRHVPPIAQIAVAAAINVTEPFAAVSWSWDFVSKMYVFYLLGIYGAPLIFRMVARRPIGFLATSIAAYAIAATWIMQSFPSFNDGNQGLIRLFLSTAGVFAAVNIMAMLQHSPAVKPFEKIGRRTLPVFLMHIPMLAILAIVADQFLDADPGLPGQPVIATGVAAALCLGLYRLILRAGGRWLFTRPDWVVGLTTPRVAAAAAPSPAPEAPAAAPSPAAEVNPPRVRLNGACGVVSGSEGERR